MIRKVTTTSERALQASYVVSLLVAKAKKPFTIVEELLLPAAKVLAETMLDKTAADKFNAVPLSNDTVSRRLDVMATDIVDQVVAKLTGSFALQLDESIDVSESAQLVGFVRYCDADDIAEHIGVRKGGVSGVKTPPLKNGVQSYIQYMVINRL